MELHNDIMLKILWQKGKCTLLYKMAPLSGTRILEKKARVKPFSKLIEDWKNVLNISNASTNRALQIIISSLKRNNQTLEQKFDGL
jgi:hypothetical protein